MQLSQIVIPTPSDDNRDPRRARLSVAYQIERKRLEVVDVELNRARIFMLDHEGNIKQVALISEH